MPTNLSALLRYRTIDSCLRNVLRKYTLEDLAEACGNALYEHLGIDKIPGERTMYKDIKMMKSGALGYEAPIENIRFEVPEYRNGELVKSYYAYSDAAFSIYNYNLPQEDIQLLRESLTVLKQFKEFTFLKDIEGVISKLDAKIATANECAIVGFEKVPNATGLRWINIIFSAIRNQQVLKIKYQPFQNDTSFQYEIHPYYLKEYNNRWFLFGLSVKEGYISRIFNLGLDRILVVNFLDLPFISNTVFDPKTYFKHIIGVTRPPESTPERIVLSFHPVRGKYVLTKPIHESQRTLIANDEEIRVELFLVVNKELEMEALSFGGDVKIISPASLKETIVEHLKKNLYENYKRNILVL